MDLGGSGHRRFEGDGSGPRMAELVAEREDRATLERLTERGHRDTADLLEEMDAE